MQKILITLRERALSPITIIGWLSSSLVTSAIGPFNTYSVIPFGERVLFWLVILFIAVTSAIAIQMVLRHLFPALKIISLSVISSSIFILLFWGLILQIIKYVYDDLVLPDPLLLLAIIIGVTLPIFGMIYLISPETLWPSPALSEPSPKPEASSAKSDTSYPQSNGKPVLNGSNLFLQKFVPEGGNILIRLAMRDHYLEVFTETGQKLIHMRFSDALQHVAEMNGEQIHRSHWINFDEISEVVRQSGKIGFRMSDGAVVPIARSRKSALKDRGLL